MFGTDRDAGMVSVQVMELFLRCNFATSNKVHRKRVCIREVQSAVIRTRTLTGMCKNNRMWNL
jgi:hypothetical protein